jgi:hypothetical protein
VELLGPVAGGIKVVPSNYELQVRVTYRPSGQLAPACQLEVMFASTCL